MWNRFKRTFGINDPMMGLKGGHEGIWYTWCNNQENKARIYCRLDRIYINKHEMSTIQKAGQYLINVIPVSMFDHSPNCGMININKEGQQDENQCKKTLFKLNVSLVDN